MEVKRLKRYLRLLVIAGLAVCGLAAAEHHGLVKVGGVPIPGATITATQDDKKVVVVTDENGIYSFPDLTDGVWKIQVEMLCFSPETKEIGIAPGAPGAEWELKLLPMDQIKASMQTAPPASTPAATTPAPGQPTATPAPGTPAQPTQTAAATQTSKTPAKNGKGKGQTPATPQAGFQRTDVNASGDGAAAAASSAPIASASDSGASSGDSFVVNGSGSNGIERRAIGNARKGPGSLFNGGINYQFDNSVLNARNYSLNGADTPKTPYNHFQVGLNFGGPLWIPHVFRWTGNFFLTYQTTRNRTSNTGTGIMPTADEKAGIFTQETVKDPTTGQPFPNNVIPDTRISPQAKSLLQYYPAPNFATATGGFNYNYQAALIGRNSVDLGQVRINKTINNKNYLNTSFGIQDSSTDTPNLFHFVDNNHVLGYQFSASLRRTFSRNLYGTFGAQFSRSSVQLSPFFAYKTDVSGQAGITGNDRNPGNYGPPSLSFTSGISGLSDAEESLNRNQTAAFSVSMNYIRRPHNFQFGGDYRIQNFNVLSQANGRGAFDFNNAPGQTVTGFDFADFLLGIPTGARLALGNADKYLRAGMYDAFLNDDWRVGPSFTLNWGVRWEYGSPVTEERGRLVNLDIAQGFVNSSPVVAYSPNGPLSHTGYADSLINPDRHAFQPRISFAWKPIFGASTTVRGGYGVYYNTAAYGNIARRMVQQSPLSKSLDVQNTGNLTLANGFIPSALSTNTTFAVDPHYRVGYSQNWTISVQQNVTASMVLTATYLGIKGTRQPQAFYPNTFPDGRLACATCLPGYQYLTSNGNSTSHAGTLGLRRRFHGGLSTNFSYTYSKAMDDATPGGQTWSIAQNWLDLSAERALSSTDQRHLFKTSFQYSTGAGLHGGSLLGGWRGAAFKGWTVTGDIVVGSGFPFSPVYSGLIPGTSISGTLRPQYVGGDIYSNQGGRFLNYAAFGAPPAGQWGNAGRNIIIGPNQFSFNASMQRAFKDNITVRFDSNNVLNHPTFSSWNATFVPGLPSGGSFGLPNPPGGMRTLQATLRWSF